MKADTRAAVRYCARIVAGLALLALLAGVGLLALSCIPYETIRARADAFTLDGSADTLTRDLFARMVARLRWLAGGLAVAAVLLFKGREPIAQQVVSLARSAAQAWAGARAGAASAWQRTPLSHRVALIAVTLSAVGVRLFYLGLPMRYDESYTVMRYAAKPLYIALTDYSAPNNHLFHTLLVYIALRLFGWHEWAIRLPALLAGVALVPAGYALARKLYGLSAGLIAAALIAGSSALVEYSVNARGYTIVAALFLTLWLLATWLAGHSNAAVWLLFAALAALGLWTVPIMLYPVGIVGLWLLLSWIAHEPARAGRRALASRWHELALALGVTAFLTALCYAPVMITAGPGAVTGNVFVTPQPWRQFGSALVASLGPVWAQWNRDIPLPLGILLAAAAVGATIAHGRLARWQVPPLVPVLLWCPVLLILQRVVPYRRVWLFLLPLYLTLAAAGLTAAAARLVRGHKTYPVVAALAAVALAVGLALNVVLARSVYFSNETETLRDAPYIVAMLRDELRPGDRVLTVAPSDTILEYYFTVQGVPLTYLVSESGPGGRVFVVVNDVAGDDSPDRLGQWLKQAALFARFPFSRLYLVLP